MRIFARPVAESSGKMKTYAAVAAGLCGRLAPIAGNRLSLVLINAGIAIKHCWFAVKTAGAASRNFSRIKDVCTAAGR